jgi:hypothetical protein
VAAPLEAGDLGTIGTGDALRSAVTAALGAPEAKHAAPTSTAASTASAPPCTDQLTGAEPLGALRLVATATVDGAPSAVLVFDLPGQPPKLRAFAVDPADCRVVRAETFPAP